MFDGNHRTRRNINLGGGPAVRGKRSILEASKRKRQDRFYEQRKVAAALSLQKQFRGNQLRKELEQQICQQTAATSSMSLAERSRLWNVRFGLLEPGSNDAEGDSRNSLLAEFASQIDASNQQQQPLSSAPPPLLHRVVKATFQSLQRVLAGPGPQLQQQTHLYLTYQTILGHALGGSNLVLQQQTSHQPQAWMNIGFHSGYRLAVHTLLLLQSCTATISSITTTSNHGMLAVRDMIHQAVRQATPLSVQEGTALLETLALVGSPVPAGDTSNVLLPRNLESLLAVLTPPPLDVATTTQDTSTARLLGELVHHVVAAHSAAILLHILQIQSSSSAMSSLDATTNVIIPLVAALFQQSHLLQLATGMVVRGESLEPTSLDSLLRQLTNTTAARRKNDDDDSSSSDEDLVQQRRSRGATSQVASTTTSYSSSSTKQEFLTLPKLDRLSNSRYASWRSACLQSAAASSSSRGSSTIIDVDTLQVAQRLGDPALWISWGQTVLALPLSVQDTSRQQVQATYIHLLSMLLLHATGLKPRQSATSPFLAKLAFYQNDGQLTLLELIWKLILEIKNSNNRVNGSAVVLLEAWSIVSDIFTHKLVPLSDEHFLDQYTTRIPTLYSLDLNQKTRGKKSCIVAQDVVADLRDQLHDLYWAVPVRADDVRLMFRNEDVIVSDKQNETKLQIARARLLVTGTKLYTTLYERWSRLRLQQPFCDESTWLFPTMIHFWSDSAVVGAGQNARMVDDDDGDAMEVDLDSADVLADRFSDPKIARVLTYVPFVVPFERRFKLFLSLVANDKLATQNEDVATRTALLSMMRGEEFDLTSGRVKVSIRRDKLYEDSMTALNALGPRLKRRVQVSFLNQHGAQEAGIDGGGVFKEFTDDLIRDAFRTAENSTGPYRLFEVTPLETLAVNTSLRKSATLLSHYEFLGRVLGKAVYESILVDPQFCFPFLNQLLGKQNSLEDLKNYDPEFHKNLSYLLNGTPEWIESLGMTFEITLKDGEDGKTRNVELMKGGRNIHVSRENVIQYVHLVAYHRLNVETSEQTKAFLRGFRDLIPASWVRLFSPYELQKLISGDDSVRGIDVPGLKQVMLYASGYHPSQEVVQWFWDIVENEMTPEQQRKFLKFMTSCSRQPLLGFGTLDPLPCLQQIRLPSELLQTENLEALAKETPLPSASTCMNLLKLPNYPSKQLMKWKLLTAIESASGFELT